CTSFGYQMWVFNLNQEGKARCFRIYRETLSRFRAPLHRSVAGARHYGARALVVDAIDDRAAEFYGHHGFLPLEGRRLYRRISDIARALGV
ncbi:hypothetical protein ABLO16_08105, partial [Mycobacterium tuberculosis]